MADPPGRNLAWARQLELPFRLLSDPDGRIARRWGVWDDTWNLAQRMTFVIDRGGTVRHVEVGGLAIQTDRTLEALARLARAR